MTKVLHPKSRLPLTPINDNGNKLIPAYQTTARAGMNTYISIDLRPNANTNALANGDDLLFDLEPHEANNIKDLLIEYTVSCSNARVQTSPAPYWHKIIEIKANKGSDDTLQRIYPEQIIRHYMTMNDEEREFAQKSGHIRFQNFKNHIKVLEPEYFEVGDTKKIYIPFPLSFWHMNAIMFQHMTEEIRIRISFNENFVIDGTASNLSLDNVRILIVQDELNAIEKQQWVKDNMSMDHTYNYLDVIRLEELQKTLQPNVEAKFDLQNIVARVPYLLVVHKPSTNPVASDKSIFNYLDVGDNALFELKSPNNEPLLTKGNPIDKNYVEYLWSQSMRNKPLQGFYIIPLCHDTEKADSGVIDNFFKFIGQKETLSIIYGSTGTSETHLIDTDAVATAGSYSIGYKDCITNSIPYNDSAANVAAAINSLECVKNRGYTASVDQNLDAGDMTITFDQYKDGRVSNEIGTPYIIPHTTFAGPTTITSSVSQYGKIGWESSSNRKTEIYAYFYRRLTVSKQGKLYTKTL